MVSLSDYLVTYDIRCPKRWRRAYRLLKGYGDWVQLSVFRCRLEDSRRRRLERELREVIDAEEDRLLISMLDDKASDVQASPATRRAVVL